MSKDSVGTRFNAPAPPHVVKMNFGGGGPSQDFCGIAAAGKVNYFVGNDKTKWRAGVPTYAKVR